MCVSTRSSQLLKVKSTSKHETCYSSSWYCQGKWLMLKTGKAQCSFKLTKAISATRTMLNWPNITHYTCSLLTFHLQQCCRMRRPQFRASLPAYLPLFHSFSTISLALLHSVWITSLPLLHCFSTIFLHFLHKIPPLLVQKRATILAANLPWIFLQPNAFIANIALLFYICLLRYTSFPWDCSESTH